VGIWLHSNGLLLYDNNLKTAVYKDIPKVSQFTTPINMVSEGQRRVLPLYGSAVLDRSSTGFTSLLAALIVETGTAIDSGPSGFGRTESAP